MDKNTQFGFIFGSAEVERLWTHEGRVGIGIKTPKQNLEVYVTKTGKIRVFTDSGIELKDSTKTAHTVWVRKEQQNDATR